MNKLWLYDALSRLRWLNYRGKIMLTAFIGTHIPLLALIGLFAWWTSPDLRQALTVTGVALAATLIGTGLTLFVLNELLRPILLTGRALRSYTISRALPNLPTHYTDEAGRLMHDACYALGKLDTVLNELAYFDPVTGLPNRDRLLRLMAARMADPEQPFALGMIRFLNHDRILSTFGQQAADGAMKVVAQRLEATVARGTAIARAGSDMFAVIIAECENVDTVARALQSIVDAVGGEVVVGEVKLVAELAGGIAFYPLDAAEPEALLNDAVLALTQSETVPATNVAFFSVASREAAQERFAVEQDLRRALEQGEFTLHFQPAIDLAARRVVGAEALVRWRHPQRGLIPPALFVPIAESSGLADELGLWVLNAACAEAKAWKDRGFDGLKLAVNVSARHFRNPALVRSIGDTLSNHALPPQSIELELTETAAMVDARRTSQLFGELHDMGLTIAIDDFGTGYSSMSYLKNLPFDKLKIDREFVSGVSTRRDCQAICKAIIELGAGLHLDVLAEGTETEQEVRELQRLGCHMFQGYYFARPMPSADLVAKLGDTGWLNLQAAAAA